jgi:putative membrane protein
MRSIMAAGPRSASTALGLGIVLSAVRAAPALAHDGRPLTPHDLWAAWEWSPLITIPLGIAAAMYGVGVRRVWQRAGRGRGLTRRDVMSFALGWGALAVALVSPLHALGGVLFAAHMAQHELIMVIAAPLLVLGRPLIAFVWAFPPLLRRTAASLARAAPARATWRVLTSATVAWWLHAVAIGAWHLPRPYEATLSSDAIHALQHTSFLVTALLFWWAALHPSRGRQGAALVYLFVAILITGALGALLAFSPAVWYPAYSATTRAWGLTPTEDQQLGGIIMWIPGGVSYIIAALAIVAGWLRDSKRWAGNPRYVYSRNVAPQ